MDIDEHKIETLKEGKVPIYELDFKNFNEKYKGKESNLQQIWNML